MNIKDKSYVFLCTFYITVVVVSNLVYRKFIFLKLPFYSVEISVAILLYPFTFFLLDLITEFYGKQKANYCVTLLVIINLLIGAIVFGMDLMPATPWSEVNDKTFHLVFGFFGAVSILSLMVCFVSQRLNVFLFMAIKKLTKGKHLWLRNNASTLISLLLDTILINCLTALFKIIPAEHLKDIIISSYTWKAFFTISISPFFYVISGLFRKVTGTRTI